MKLRSSSSESLLSGAFATTLLRDRLRDASTDIPLVVERELESVSPLDDEASRADPHVASRDPSIPPVEESMTESSKYEREWECDWRNDELSSNESSRGVKTSAIAASRSSIKRDERGPLSSTESEVRVGKDRDVTLVSEVGASMGAVMEILGTERPPPEATEPWSDEELDTLLAEPRADFPMMIQVSIRWKTNK